MSWLKSVTTVFAVLTLTTLVWASQSDDVSDQSDAPEGEVFEAPAAAEESAEATTDEGSVFPEDAAAFPEEEQADEFAAPVRTRPVPRDLKQQLIQLLNHEIQRKLQGRDSGHRRGLRRDVEQQLRDRLSGLSHSVASDAVPYSEDHESHRPGPHGDLERRLDHLHAAIRHLHEAGLPEIAEQVEVHAVAIQEALQSLHNHAHAEHVHGEAVHEGHGDRDQHHAHNNHEHEHHDHGGQDVLQELMEQVGRLRNEIGQLRDQVRSLENQ